MRITIGPSLDAVKRQAEDAVDAAIGQPLDRYTAKVVEARRVVAGEKSTLLSAEAALRGVKVEQLAQSILEKRAADDDLELQRVKTKLAIRKASSEARIRKIMKKNGISMPARNGGVPYGL